MAFLFRPFMLRLRKIYLICFVLFFRAGGRDWDYGTNVWKGVLGVAMLEFALAMTASAWIGELTGADLLLGVEQWEFTILFAGVFGLNYYVLVSRAVGSDYERAFAALEKRQRRTLSLLGIVTIGLIMGLMFFSLSALGPHAK